MPEALGSTYLPARLPALTRTTRLRMPERHGMVIGASHGALVFLLKRRDSRDHGGPLYSQNDCAAKATL
jgi:hypothetical protein